MEVSNIALQAGPRKLCIGNFSDPWSSTRPAFPDEPVAEDMQRTRHDI